MKPGNILNPETITYALNAFRRMWISSLLSYYREINLSHLWDMENSGDHEMLSLTIHSPATGGFF
jgi:hypothetical protein